MNTNESVSDYHAAISGPFLHFMKIGVWSWIEIIQMLHQVQREIEYYLVE